MGDFLKMIGGVLLSVALLCITFFIVKGSWMLASGALDRIFDAVAGA